MKEKRDRLFRVNRPRLRPIELFDGQTFGKDMGVMWAAYKLGTFDDRIEPGLSQIEFANLMVNIASEYTDSWLVEDKNPKYKNEYGPVGWFAAVYNGWEIEPHFEKFSWATSRNILRSVVSFLQMMRYDKRVAVVSVYSRKRDKKFFDHVTGYGVLRYAGKIPRGEVDSDRYIYYTNGKKKCQEPLKV